MSYVAVAALLAVFVPLLAMPGIIALRHRPNLREAVSLAAAVLTFGLAASLIPAALAGDVTRVVLFSVAPGLDFALRPDPLGLLFAAVASFLWILTTVYSIGYMRGREEHAQTRYYLFFAAAMGGTMGVALSANLLSLLIFYEILTVSTYPLVVHHEGKEDFRAGRKYLVYTLGGGGAILAALAIAYGLAGNVDFVSGGNPALRASTFPFEAVRSLAFLLVLGFGVKATLIPLHGWLPSAMVAPTPVSGLLHAVAVVKAGVFGILRTLYFFVGPELAAATGVQLFVLVMASLTIVIGSVFALLQDNLKRRLAYSTISQLSYISLGAALLTPAGLLGAGFHVAAHGFTKLAMFFVAGAILVQTGKTRISELGGLGRRMPAVFGAFALAAVAMAALPPLSPFVSKFYLSAGASDASLVIPVLILLTSSVLNMAYFFPIVARAFLRRGEARPTTRTPTPLLLPILIAVVGSLVLGVWLGLPGGPFVLVQTVVLQVFTLGAPAFAPWAAEHLLESLVVVGAGFLVAGLAFWEFRAAERPLLSSVPVRGFLGASQALFRGFRLVYEGAVAGTKALGSASRRLQTGDLNWNNIGLAVGLLLVLLWLLWGWP